MLAGAYILQGHHDARKLLLYASAIVAQARNACKTALAWQRTSQQQQQNRNENPPATHT